MSRRSQGIQRAALIFGNISIPIAKDKTVQDPKATHRWTVYVRDPDGLCLSNLFKQVVFVLHPSFPNHRRVVTQSPFAVTEAGWGEFEITIELHFHDDCEEPPVVLQHFIRLFLDPPVKNEKLTKKPVISEQAEELLFVNPTETFHERAFVQPRQIAPLPPLLEPVLTAYSKLSIQTYDEIKSIQINEARKFVQAQIEHVLFLHQQLNIHNEFSLVVDKLQKENQLPTITSLPNNTGNNNANANPNGMIIPPQQMQMVQQQPQQQQQMMQQPPQ